MRPSRFPRLPARAAVGVVIVASAAVPVAAQPSPRGPATTPPSAPAISDPAAPPATNPDGTPVTTAPDPLGGASEGLSAGAYASQPPFDPASLLPLVDQVASARTRVRRATTAWQEVQDAITQAFSEFGDLDRQWETLGVEKDGQIAGATESRSQLRRRAVQAFIRGDQSVDLLSAVSDPAEYSRAKRYLEALAGLDQAAVDEYQAQISLLDSAQRKLVERQAAIQRRIDGLVADRTRAHAEVLRSERCLAAFQMGSRVCVDDFVFPLLGEVTFVDTWGAPRMPGTPDQHWHEGTDILAPEGREVVAVEDGVLHQVGAQGLGGERLWLKGDSGNDYYYAHVSSYTPAAIEGARVTAGTVLAYNGSTGNAAGGAPHLHFEIHTPDGAPVDPYPQLKAAWGVNRPMLPASAVMDRPGSAQRAPVPVEELDPRPDRPGPDDPGGR